MEYFIGFIVGVVIGAGIAIVVSLLRSRSANRQMRETFASLAGEALDANSKRLTEQAASAMDGRKALIDQSVKAVNERLGDIRQFIQRTETQRKEDVGRLGSSVASLATTTGELHRMLASTQRRGAWGERMAEDVLRLAGMEEGINYAKQSSADTESGRPDFTFFLPNDLKANMDVKFPLESYKAYVDADTDDGRSASLKSLTTAVRMHVKDVARRGYIDPAAPTVDYVIVFIPSEQIYSLVLSAEADLIDDALRQKVVLASPLTLYAMLAVIRQAAENANVMKTADEIITVLGQFNYQWQKYNEEMDKLGQRMASAASQFEMVRTTRTNMLQKPLDKIDTLRTTRGLPPR